MPCQVSVHTFLRPWLLGSNVQAASQSHLVITISLQKLSFRTEQQLADISIAAHRHAQVMSSLQGQVLSMPLQAQQSFAALQALTQAAVSVFPPSPSCAVALAFLPLANLSRFS